MNDFFLYFNSFLFGFLGSIHCISMCGGILSFFLTDFYKYNIRETFFNQIFYNLGRVLSYGLIGLVSGFLGFILSSLVSYHSVYLIKIISAFMMMILGIYLITSFDFFLYFNITNYINLNFFFRKSLFLRRPYKDFFLGLLWGNIPCSFIYSAVCLSLLTESICKGCLSMILFGFGTTPAIVLTVTLYTSIKNFSKFHFFKKVYGCIIFFFGIYMFINTLPYQSCHLIINHF